MKPSFNLIEEGFNTEYAPLCVLGQALWERKTLQEIRESSLIRMKTHDHTPGEKLIDAISLIMAGYPSLYLLNNTLRSDPMISKCWHREKGLAEQSSVSRVLDRYDEKGLKGLEEISHRFWEKHNRTKNHDWRSKLVVDLDLTPLEASKKAEGSRKGYMAKKTKQGDNYHGSCCIHIGKHYCPNYIQEINIVPIVCKQQ